MSTGIVKLPDGWITRAEADRIRAEAHARGHEVCICAPIIDTGPDGGPAGRIIEALFSRLLTTRPVPEAEPEI